MTRRIPARMPDVRRGLTNGNLPHGARGPAGVLVSTRGRGFTNGNGATNGLTNGLRGRTNGLTNGLKGRTNGLTNGLSTGRGATNGLTNGLRGRTNGLTNGLKGHTSGFTNGTGAVNGLVNGTLRRAIRRNPFGIITQRDARFGVAIIVLALLVLPTLYIIVMTPTTAPSVIAIDGDLRDWGTRFINDSVPSPNADVALERYSAAVQDGGLDLAVQVQGTAFADPDRFAGFYVFIDSDGNPATGYLVRGTGGGIGADEMAVAKGFGGNVTDAALYTLGAGSNQMDWSRWELSDRILGAGPGAHPRDGSSVIGVEMRVPPGEVSLGPDATFLVFATDYNGNATTSSVIFGLSLRALLVTQGPANAGGVVPASGGAFASLTYTMFGTPSVDVTSTSLTKVRGSGDLTSLGTIGVGEGTPETRTIPVTFTTPGDYVIARLDRSGLQLAADIPVTIEGPDIVSYLGTAPTDHRVDGYFGDWDLSHAGSDFMAVDDRNIDIQNYMANRTGSTAFLYADVRGQVLGGTAAPERVIKTAGGAGQGVPSAPPLRTGEDVFVAYIQSNTSRNVGPAILGVRADFYVEVRGFHGRVDSKQAYEWRSGAWALSSKTVEFANDRSRLEASLDLTGVAVGPMMVVIQATDWASLSDTTGIFGPVSHPGGGGTRGAPGLEPLHGTDAALALAPPLSGTPLVDGDCTDAAYSTAGTFSDTGISGKVGTASQYVYVCVDVTGDTTDNATLDKGFIYFDTLHDGGTTPQTDDRRFNVSSDNSTIFQWEGDGTTWVSCSSPDCDSANQAAGAFMSGHEVYEFKIRFANVWGTDSPTDGQRAGFAVRALDNATASYITWGSTDPPSDTSPDTWGHLDIPEFPAIAIPIAVVGTICLVALRRRRSKDS